MSKDFTQSYNPQEVEDDIYKKWEESGYFNPDNLDLPEDAKTYTIILPPPNITAKLHLGHASILATQDLMIRFHRMNSYRTLWLPGTDHAAIATQNVVEKRLYKETGKTRHDLGKEKFLEMVWEFLQETQATILHQFRKMGASLDWSREAFTLDNQRKKAVKRMFIDMYNEGVIYRGERIVNWCPRCKSTLADDEVEHEEQKAKLYTFKYWKDFPFAISTTRPETKLGDTAVAVNPKDERYKNYIGQEFEGEFCEIKLKIKVIADREVDPKFGTGALGVTPAHSMTDWKMAENNNLKIIKVINEDGKIHDNFGEFSGLSTKEVQTKIIEKLKANNLIEKEEEIENNLSVCYRCDTAIEPLPSQQWFISVNKKLERLGGLSLKEKAIKVAKEKEIEFLPNRFTKRYLDWMENLHDWCISRQIWFGHEIPAWHREIDGKKEIFVGEEKPKGADWKQDPDSLDTWFSSGMWTFSTLGWPDTFEDGKKSGDLKKFHPTQMLGTGNEILTLWVSRMIMMTLFAINEIPFEKVYLNGTILDNNGKKMSKSKGNGIDPLDMTEKYGTDASRLSLLIGNTPGNDARLSEEKVEQFRNFTNKLWNIGRYVANSNFDLEKINNLKDVELSNADKWILEKLTKVNTEVTENLKQYNFSIAGEVLRNFTWNDFADWYVEVHKIEKNDIVLAYIYKQIVKMWHPFIPFVTEKIWQEMFATSENNLLMIEKWTTAESLKSELNTTLLENNFNLIQELIVKIRNIRSTYNVAANENVNITLVISNENNPIVENENVIKKLSNVAEIKIIEKDELQKQSASDIVSNLKLYVHLENVIDIEKEKQRIEQDLQKTIGYQKGLEKRLASEFVKKAPQEVVEKEKENLKQAQEKIIKLEEHLKNLS